MITFSAVPGSLSQQAAFGETIAMEKEMLFSYKKF